MTTDAKQAREQWKDESYVAPPWKLEPNGDIVDANGVVVLKVWNGYDNGVSAVTAVNEHSALLERVQLLERVLSDLLEVCSCQNGCPPEDMRCATNAARAALENKQ